MTTPLEYNASTSLNRAQVRSLQRLLGASTDGRWGPKTIGLLKAWQSGKRLDPDGKFGPSSQFHAGLVDPSILVVYDKGGTPRKSPDPRLTMRAYEVAKARDLVLMIDLSHHNPEPDWDALYALGYRVAIFKGWEGSGGDFHARTAYPRMERAKAAGFFVTLYGWALLHRRITPQIETALRVIKNVPVPCDLPVFIDTEDLYGVSTAAAVKGLDEYADGLEVAGVKAGLYSGDYFHARSLEAMKASKRTWIRWLAWYPKAHQFHLDSEPAYSPEWDFWQSMSRGSHPSMTSGQRLARFDIGYAKRSVLEQLTGVSLCHRSAA